jgi:ribonuclease HI
MHIKINFDGAVSESKKGCDMGLGIAVFIDGVYEEDLSKALFVKGSNKENEESSSNVAEWMACVEAFKLAVEYREEGDVIEIYSDSEIITKQFNGEYEIRKEYFRKFYREAMRYYHRLGLLSLKITWVPREKNKEADRLSKIGLKKLNSCGEKDKSNIPEIREA